MSTAKQTEALRLADKYEAHGFLGDHRFAKDHWCMQAAAELRRQHARIADLEAQLSAIAHTAEGVPAQIETLRAELAEETEAADNWRRLALQFDNHRMQALGHLKAILHPDSSVVDEYKAAELFLKAPPLDGEEVLAQRIAELAAAATQAKEDACWSGWACMYPGKLPRLYGALEIASVNLDAANGDQLIHLSTSPDPKTQAVAEDQDVLTMANALIAQRTTDALDAARYRFLRDTCWSSDKELATVISLQMNKVWDEKIDEAMARNKRSN